MWILPPPRRCALALRRLAMTLPWCTFAVGALAAQPSTDPARSLQSAPVEGLRFEVLAGRREIDERVLRVVVRFTAPQGGPVLLSMAAWTPGSYHIANYARGVAGFTASADGQPLRWDKRDPDTWRIQAPRGARVELRYTVRADELDVAASWTGEDFAFFNGTNLFLYVEGRPETPAQVVVRGEPTWRVATGMAADDSTHRFRARDVHDLLDHPVFVGRFDLDSARVAEKWMRLATYPVGSVQGARRAALWDALTRSVDPLRAVFGGEAPWDSYTVLQVAHDEVSGMSALEHAESELAIVGTAYLDEPFVHSVHAHEIVHAWNVKRLRPADLTPYRYDQPQPTPFLWVSEGITDYYADLALVRGGLVDETGFLATTLGKIDGVAARPATALEDASLQSWLAVRDGTDDLYYDKGSLAGFALDILIRDASGNRASLDHVMRELYDVSYRQGRGFTHDDFWNAVARATRGRAWGEFERRYVDGREPYPWAEWLAKAGWRLVQDSISEPRLGVLLRGHPEGVQVIGLDPEGMAAKAGIELGDILLDIGGMATDDPRFGERWRDVWGARNGASLTITLKREEMRFSRTAIVEVDTRVERRIEPDPNASTRARQIRAGILEGLPRP